MSRDFLGTLTRVALVLAGIVRVLRSPSRPHAARGNAPEHAPSRRSGIRQWAIKGIALLAFGAIAGFLFVASGLVPIKASSGHWPVTAWFLSFAMRRSVETHTLWMRAPSLDEPALVLKGAGHYEIGCRPCHGGPDLAPPTIARRMTPHPPNLPEVIPEYDPEGLFYVVKHGVKFTGMPAWPAQQRDDEVWAMVAFLRQLPEMDATVYRRLVNGPSVIPDPPAELEPIGSPPVPGAVLTSCSRCHGVDGLGRGPGAFPRLAGQRPAYVAAALRAYATGKRHSGIMQPIAAGLDNAQMHELARYFASLPAEEPETGSRKLTAEIEQGGAIAAHGLPDLLVPPCARCHGPGPQRPNPQYPRLAGQHAGYLMLQLELFKARRRGGSAYHDIMYRVAGQLTDEHVRAVATYYASLPGDADGGAP